MDSEDFFTNDTGQYFKTRQGIYVINMPLFKYRGQSIYKVGYARDNLYKRIRDYKTAYGPIHFIIEAIYEIPEKVFHKRPNFALLSETRIHKTLIKMDKANLVMRDEDTDKQLGEWFFGIKDIISVIKGLKDEYESDKTIANVAKHWKLEYNMKYKDVKPYQDLHEASQVNSSLSKLEVINRSALDRHKAKKLDENYVYDKEFKKAVAVNKLGIGAPKPSR
jgi:hypothetical protein